MGLNKKRQMIREGIKAIYLMPLPEFGGQLDTLERVAEFRADYTMSFLDESGCVLRTDGGLPSVFDSNEDVMSALKYREKLAGYVAVEPLIEEQVAGTPD